MLEIASSTEFTEKRTSATQNVAGKYVDRFKNGLGIGFNFRNVCRSFESDPLQYTK